ncbi:hypothetical protein MPDQ_004427 [Monascus purpureus]|uniref:Uncharacterized protein n=1 Tax=Monascus purpureus TaxID=5098 RepID=A0A507QLP2_MONPU|nr:hypothetical protein MPDQ_004427 [Monascus purpureus]BDD63003.1 hypothetical protein MAP00_007955 [Monascus purpureus]
MSKYLYVPASSRSSRKDIGASSYTTTPSRTPDQTPHPSGQTCLYDPTKYPQSQAAQQRDKYNYVPASSLTSRKDIDESSYTTTPSRTPGERTPLSGQCCYAASRWDANSASFAGLNDMTERAWRGSHPEASVNEHGNAHANNGDADEKHGNQEDNNNYEVAVFERPDLTSRRSMEIIDSLLEGLQREEEKEEEGSENKASEDKNIANANGDCDCNKNETDRNNNITPFHGNVDIDINDCRDGMQTPEPTPRVLVDQY